MKTAFRRTDRKTECCQQNLQRDWQENTKLSEEWTERQKAFRKTDRPEADRHTDRKTQHYEKT